MTEFLDYATDWVLGLGDAYGVNPVIFGILYIASIPPYLASIGWIVRNYRRGKPIALPVMSTGLFFIAPAIYLLAAGRNVPWAFYAAIGFMVLYGIFTTWKKVNKRVNKEAGVQ